MGAKYAGAAKLLLALSKSGGLPVAISAAWVLIDLRVLIDSAPGKGSLILGSIPAATSLLMLFVEFHFWLHPLPTALKQINRVLPVPDHDSHDRNSHCGRSAGRNSSEPEVRRICYLACTPASDRQ